MICAIGESTALAVRGYAENHRMPGGARRKSAAERVAIPTRHDGKRYRRLAKGERGAEVFAAWCLILGVAARCPTPGVLVDEQGEALWAEDLSDMTGFPAELFELGIAALLDERIGWLERVPLGLALEEKESEDKGSRVSKPGGGTDSAGRGVGVLGETRAVGKEVENRSIRGSAMESESAPSRAEGVGAAGAVAGGSESEIDLDRPEDKCGSDRQEAPRGLIASAAGTASIAGMMQHGAEEPKDAKAKRIDDVEERLFHLGLLDRVSPDLYRPKEVTGQFILELWRQVDADTGVGDRGEAFLERLKKWVLNHSGAAAVRPAVRGA